MAIDEQALREHPERVLTDSAATVQAAKAVIGEQQGPYQGAARSGSALPTQLAAATRTAACHGGRSVLSARAESATRDIVVRAGFHRFRRVAEAPFNVVYPGGS
ncbi:hypothetical protein QMK19_02370 [Streptomyces sp. H10-C2]|uniref:hypothetical protein n=1 Tax=unclassified Streptomyces TaxID=2593676 RepID=UPI0024B9E536|nr:MULTISPECIES: hypothetical protein [unclassified Streptomyces]MDJ0342592.1 hypothetical protein [Streptomyces sp. PH10-H1]MDJ0368554.1 hypothetical protein [Streptomyces sp. H10-C2]